MYVKTAAGYKYFRIDSVTYQQIYNLYFETGIIK